MLQELLPQLLRLLSTPQLVRAFKTLVVSEIVFLRGIHRDRALYPSAGTRVHCGGETHFYTRMCSEAQTFTCICK